jgi:Fur family peroxide stress response transcriptional regulator
LEQNRLNQMKAHTATTTLCDEMIASHGLRMTEQRRQVYDALMAVRNHPTATEVFFRVKEKMPSISLATVYNCLETLTECGLIRHVHRDRESSRYCPNLEDHGHFFCENCGAILDVPFRKHSCQGYELPANAVVLGRDVNFRGICPDCVKKQSNAKRKSRP